MFNESTIDIIIYAIIAVALILKLVSTMGKRTDDEVSSEEFLQESQKPTPFSSKSATKKQQQSKEYKGKIIDIQPQTESTIDLSRYEHLEAPLQNIINIDPHFEPEKFISNANKAFEIILLAYAQADIDTLDNLVKGDIHDQLIESINNRKADNYTMEEKNLLGINASSFYNIQLHDTIAVIDIRFETDQIYAIYNEDGDVIEGDSHHLIKRDDIWSFQRDLQSEDKRWLLIEARPAEA